MKYQSVVFLEHEETDRDNGLVTDEALRILHHKPTDPDDPDYGSVLWEIPTAADVRRTLDYLLQWEYGEPGETTDYEPWGCADEIIRTRRGNVNYVISYNVGLSYIALTRPIAERRKK